jgi:4-amino-4-deoxy-L-arabinose transferase-like glycosyltransferase
MPIKQAFQFDTDEGIELIKSSLYSQGFTLYTQIWNEQPPLLTLLLSHWFDLFGKSIFAARLLILSFATLLIWSFCQTLRICLGILPAVIGTLLLSVSCNFLRLSVSAMIGLPSLAFAMLSIYTLILYHQKHRLYLIILSGSFLALSLQTKLFTVFLVPILLIKLIELKFREPNPERVPIKLFYPVFWWLLSLLAVFTFIGLSSHSLSFDQLLQANLGQNVKEAFPRKSSFQNIILMFLQDLDYVVLAIIGVREFLKKKEGLINLPLVWIGIVTLFLLNYKPIWYHHYLLLSIPLTWLATYGVALALEDFKLQQWYSTLNLRNIKKLAISNVTVSFFILSLVLIPIKLTVIQVQNYLVVKESKSYIEILDNLLKYKPSTQWVFTDLPIYAFHADLNVPPEIAVFARKRLASGYLTGELLTSVMERYHPEQVILGRFPEVRNDLRDYLNKNYLKIYEKESTTHYLLRNLSSGTKLQA